MFTALILICAATIKISDCTEKNARVVMHVPQAAGLEAPAACWLRAQAYLGETEIGRSLGDGEYVKIRCGG
jgi:hypothetical protein